MGSQIFVNPGKNPNRSVDFSTKLGFSFNAQATDENATRIIHNDTRFVLLLVEPFFQTFTKKRIADNTQRNEVALESREKVDELVEKALANGGPANDPQDHGRKYSQRFRDPDGHVWEPQWADLSQLPGT